MHPKDSKIQDALGLLTIYEGYIKVGDTPRNDFIVYYIKAPTRKSAKHRLKSIVKKLTAQGDVEYKLWGVVNSSKDPRPANIYILETRETTV